MRSLPKVTFTRRARNDIRDLLLFIGRQPWGKPLDRKAEFDVAIEQIRRMPEVRPVRRTVASGIGLRCRYAGQLAVVYAILKRAGKRSHIAVSVRAVRHWRVRNVFSGVREIGDAISFVPLNTR